MIQSLPPIIWVGIIISGIFAILALYYVITTPRDTRLDDLIKAVNNLNQPQKTADINKPSVNIDCKINTADINKMNP